MPNNHELPRDDLSPHPVLRRWLAGVLCASQAVGAAAWAEQEAVHQAPGGAAAPLKKPQAIQVAALDAPVVVGYNTAFLYGMTSTTDIRTLLAGSGVPPGFQRVDFYINQMLAGRLDVEFSLNPKSDEIEPCITVAMLEQGGVDLAKLPSPLEPGASCMRLQEVIPDASAAYDMASLRLNVSVPQIYMTSLRRGYIDPSLWETGADVAFLNYSLNARRSELQHGDSRNDLSASVRSGVNLGEWRLRNDSYLTSGSRRPTEFRSQNTYLQRGFNTLKSQMVVGETYTYSPLFDSVRFLGMQLASDEAMRPDEERGYAPVIRGTAESNATVEIRQKGYLIYTTTVAPGPFAITDLQPSGTNGDLEIAVIEASGARRIFRQAFASPPLMVREGRIKYDIAAGQVRLDRRQQEQPGFVSGSMIYGLTANTSLAAGLQASPGYLSYSLGAGLNTPLGAVSLDAIHSRSNAGGSSASGDRLNLRYARFVETTGSHVSFNVQHGLREGFRTLSDHVERNGALAGSRPGPHWSLGQGSRQRLDGYLSQPVGRGYVYLNGSYGKNWNGTASRSVSLAYSNTIGKLNYNISFTQSRNLNSSWANAHAPRHDNTLMLTLSMPLGGPGNSTHAFSTLSRQRAGTSAQAGVSGTLPFERNVSYTVAGNRDADGQRDLIRPPQCQLHPWRPLPCEQFLGIGVRRGPRRRRQPRTGLGRNLHARQDRAPGAGRGNLELLRRRDRTQWLCSHPQRHPLPRQLGDAQDTGTLQGRRYHQRHADGGAHTGRSRAGQVHGSDRTPRAVRIARGRRPAPALWRDSRRAGRHKAGNYRPARPCPDPASHRPRTRRAGRTLGQGHMPRCLYAAAKGRRRELPAPRAYLLDTHPALPRAQGPCLHCSKRCTAGLQGWRLITNA